MRRSNTKSQQACAPHGFTLIELLVVIAIISLLVSILLPSLRKAREIAEAVVCQTTMRQICVANTFYSEDYQGASATARRVIAQDTGDYDGYASIYSYLDLNAGWAYQLDAYLEITESNVIRFACPAYNKALDYYSSYMYKEPRYHKRYLQNCYSMAYSAGNDPVIRNVSLSMSRISSPAGSLQLGEHQRETQHSVFYDLQLVKKSFRYFWRLAPGMTYAMDPPHGSSMNMAFFDNHVESLSTIEMQAQGLYLFPD